MCRLCHLSIKNDRCSCLFFFFNDTATTEIYTLSLHDALPISDPTPPPASSPRAPRAGSPPPRIRRTGRLRLPSSRGSPRHAADRKSTRLNSSHLVISYAVFCLKKKTPQP